MLLFIDVYEQVYLQDGDKKQLGASDGGKRRMVTREGMVITGAVAELGGDGVIQRFGLLQCPRIPSKRRQHTPPMPFSKSG